MLRRVPFRKYYSFPAECAHLSASDIKDVTDPCDIRQGHIRLRAHETVAQTRAVQIQRHLIGMTYLRDGLQFSFAIERTVLRRPGHIHHPRKYHMLMIAILKKCFQVSL